VGISYSGRTYEEGKKIGWRDGVRAVICIIKYSPLVQRIRRPQTTSSTTIATRASSTRVPDHKS
jgi:hypothetical protein